MHGARRRRPGRADGPRAGSPGPAADRDRRSAERGGAAHLRPGRARVGIVSFVVAGWDSSDVAARLAAEHRIGVRDGLFCAHPLARRLLGEAAGRTGRRDLPPTALRASIGLGSTAAQVDRLLAALAELG
ncbi:aminotransferase class V-fold PLP-dependent enzyme [Micromonospora sp. M12]